jgi:uncharacterized hydantoinase/oxoprolinase family protein
MIKAEFEILTEDEKRAMINCHVQSLKKKAAMLEKKIEKMFESINPAGFDLVMYSEMDTYFANIQDEINEIFESAERSIDYVAYYLKQKRS